MTKKSLEFIKDLILSQDYDPALVSITAAYVKVSLKPNESFSFPLEKIKHIGIKLFVFHDSIYFQLHPNTRSK